MERRPLAPMDLGCVVLSSSYKHIYCYLRAQLNGRAAAFQAYEEGSIPFARSNKESQNANDSSPRHDHSGGAGS